MNAKTTKKATQKKTNIPKRLTWCSRVLVSSPVYYSLCTAPAAFRKEMNRLGMSDAEEWLEDSDAGRVHPLLGNKGTEAFVVCIRPTTDKRELHATLVHEATHIWQFIKDILGESAPSREFEAYGIENVYTSLADAYYYQTGQKR